MSPWVVPVAVEIAVVLPFCAVLYHFRRSLTPAALAFWLVLWTGRAAASLAGFHFLPDTGRFVLVVYTGLQLIFALGFVLVAFRLESQKRELRRLQDELERLRRQTSEQFDLDPLTGLWNRSALDRWIEEESGFRGLLVVCDLDDFKAINDAYGHLVGDEILHGLGQLLLSSIRPEDRAFRWGGDEFVLLFRNPDSEVVESRMRGLEERLQKFQIRNHGPMAVRFSWGAAPTGGRDLRESLAEADRSMYDCKRSRRKQQSAPTP